MQYKYKTRDGGDIYIVGYGKTVDGFIESDEPIENSNLELVVEPSPHMTGVVSQQNPQIIDQDKVSDQPTPREAI